ncbi:hypothetical protein DSM112329_00081 [Paraconexibacter sp. AEG42_29]|uniref:Glycosyltransferase 2-like domain-containing protein n=1 Tax=Paraconexibacter sp. AEG42_29 TaxID=2997339 RepID=A0AAU7ANT7_9ACTN
MDASIIVPLTGDPDRALRMLEALAGLPEEPQHEVVLVDDASPDLGPLLARVAGDVTVVRLPERVGSAGAVRAGLERASGRVHVVLAEGTLVHPAALTALIDALADDRIAAVTTGARHPTAARAVAWAAGTPRLHVPDAPDDGIVAALCCALAARGPVVAVPLAIAVDTASPVADHVPRARSAPGTAIEVSVVIPTLDAAADRVRACVRALQRHTDAPHELIVIDNGAPPQGFTDPVNAALRAARGDYLVVCNDDVLVDPGWWPPLRATLDSGGEDAPAVVFPRTVDSAMREDFAAWCFAFPRETLTGFAAAPGEFLHPELRVWFQDTDLLARLRAAARPPRLVPESTIRHGLSETVASPDPVLRAWIDAQIVRDRARFEQLHGAGVPGAAC